MHECERADILIVDDLPEKHLVLPGEPGGSRPEHRRRASGEEALQLLLEREFAVILLDVNMPGMSGSRRPR